MPLADLAPDRSQAAAPEHPDRRRTALRRLAAWAPGLAVALFVEVLLLKTGTQLGDTVRYAAYLGWGVLLPGTLVHRALRGRRVRLSEDLAAGVVVGMCLELAVFVLLVALGAQWLLPWWPLAVVIPMLAVPRLRRNWRWGGEPGWTTGQAWTLATVTAAVFAWVAQAEWMMHAVAPALSWYPRGDEPFHLAIAGELRNHVPPTASWVAGEPLDYHWFHHAQLAASSMISGVELRVVFLRLCLLALVPAAVLLTAAAAARLSGRGWAGPAAAALAFVVTNLPGSGAMFGEAGQLTVSLWYSPGQTYATAVLALALLLLVDLLRGGGRHPGRWALLAVTVVVMAGAKSTYLPVLGAGLGLAFLIQLLRRRLDRVLLVAGVLVVAGTVAAVVVLFRGEPQGLAIDPLMTVRKAVPPRLAGPATDPSVPLLALLTVLAVTAWCARLAGAVVVLRRRWRDPLVGVLAGSTIAGVAGTLLANHAGNSQYYFVRAAMPLGAVLAAWGLALAFERIADTRRAAVLATSGVALGLGVAAVVMYAVPGDLGLTHPGARAALAQLTVPIVLAVAGCLAGGAVSGAFRRRGSRLHTAVAVALVALSALGLMRLGSDGVRAVQYAADQGLSGGWHGRRALVVTPENLAAARWLRDHSSPDDVVATNVHCRRMAAGRCDNRQFWVAAFAERRVLVEGWGFTSRSNTDFDLSANPFERKSYYGPYWDTARLRANDAVFAAAPTPEDLALLRDRWGVRWLFVHLRGTGTYDPRLDLLADLRYSNRDARVYELRATGPR